MGRKGLLLLNHHLSVGSPIGPGWLNELGSWII